jgi:hypothetical protein
LKRGRQKTRVYLILLVTALILLTLYGLIRQETNVVIVQSPSVSDYRELYAQYPLTLQCPCSHTASKYEKIISNLEPQHHQLCSSVFVSIEWLNSLEIGMSFGYMYLDAHDYRDMIRVQFQALSQFCSLSQKTLNTSLLIFGKNDFVTSNVISLTEFDLRMQTILEHFKTSVSQQFIETLKLIQLTNDGNQLGSVLSSNWKLLSKYSLFGMDSSVDQTLELLSEPKTYGMENCSCGIQSNCSTLAYIIRFVYALETNPIMPGFLCGCLLLDSLLQSTLACLYNETCLSLMRANIYTIKPVKAKILTYSSLSPPNTTIETLLGHLFVSKWHYQTSFDHHVDCCFWWSDQWITPRCTLYRIGILQID